MFCHQAGQTITGDKDAVKAKAYAALAARAEKHTAKNGVRLCDTGHIALPNDATDAEQRFGNICPNCGGMAMPVGFRRRRWRQAARWAS